MKQRKKPKRELCFYKGDCPYKTYKNECTYPSIACNQKGHNYIRIQNFLNTLKKWIEVKL